MLDALFRVSMRRGAASLVCRIALKYPDSQIQYTNTQPMQVSSVRAVADTFGAVVLDVLKGQKACK
jgi:hypothetical protein